MSRLRFSNRLMAIALLLIPLALWGLPLLRSMRFYEYTYKLLDEGGFYQDWAYARALRINYLIAAAVSLAYGVASLRLKSRPLFVLCCLQWLAAVFIIWAQPEELYAIVPPILPNFVLFSIWGLGAYLVCHLIYHFATSNRDRAT